MLPPSSNRFEFATATRIIFGPGTMREAGSLASGLGKRALVVTGRDANRASRLFQNLGEHGVEHATFAVAGEPELDTVRKGVAAARKAGCDLVISMGGGSVIDAGKAVAVMLANEGGVLDYVEIIGRGKPLSKPSVPFIAIPTTAGTGAEVTRNAVLASPEHRVKVSLRSEHMLPRIALVDPGLTHNLPPGLTAFTGLDALTQLIEPYVSLRGSVVTDVLCLDGITRAARSLRVAFEDGSNVAAREDMAIASLFGGLALANAGLGAVHGLAGPIGAMFPAPHGAVCAALLPMVVETNIRALRERQPRADALHRFEHVARLLTGRPSATADDTAPWLRKLIADLQIPGLSRYGIKAEHAADIAAKGANASSMKANPIVLTPAELSEIVERAL